MYNLHRSWNSFASIEIFSYNLSICKPVCSRTPGCSKENLLESALEKIAFLSSDRASVDCDKNSGLIKFCQDYPWISFILCFSHRLELALKDALKEYMEPVNTMLTHLCYLYTKSSKKDELKDLWYVKGQGFPQVLIAWGRLFRVWGGGFSQYMGGSMGALKKHP